MSGEIAIRAFALAAELDACETDGSGAAEHRARGCPVPLCARIEGGAEGARLCAQNRARAAERALATGEAFLDRCHAGLSYLAAPVGGGGATALYAAPLATWAYDDLARGEAEARAVAMSLPPDEFHELRSRLSPIPAKRADALKALLAIVAGRVARDGGDESAVLVDAPAKPRGTPVSSRRGAADPARLEGELLARVRADDRSGAKGILNELLGAIFYKTSGNLDVTKARVLELIVAISRAAVESGDELGRLFGPNYPSILELSHTTSYEGLCRWVVRTLDEFMDAVYEPAPKPASSLLEPALSRIREAYAEPLTLESVARRANISAYYLSHLFQSELGETFVGYLTRTRMEAARGLLERTSLSAQEIAARVGYGDPSYFSKVFKKATGRTPHKYRRGR